MATLSAETIETLASQIARKVIDEGLGHSTWRDSFPDAYEELKNYRVDIYNDIVQCLNKL
jgi:hypothetical protein